MGQLQNSLLAHFCIPGNESSYSFGSIFNPKQISDVQMTQQNIHIMFLVLSVRRAFHGRYTPY